MKVVCVWRDQTEYAREVENWIDDFQKQTGEMVESLSPDSLEGEDFAKIHDIVEYPSVVVVDDQGCMLEMWRGVPLPSIDQVTYYKKLV